MFDLDFGHLLSSLLLDGGFSVNLNGDEPTDGFMVGGLVPSVEIVAKDIRASDLARFVAEHEDILDNLSCFFGSWNDEGTIVLDVSDNIEDGLWAYIVAQNRGQKAIWDVVNKKELPVA